MAKRVLITGASRGIGLAIAERFRRGGFEIIAPSRQEMDLSSPDSIVGYLQQGKIEADVLVNNAAENSIFSIEQLGLEAWSRMQTTNLTGPFLLIKHLAPAMARKGWGRIVNISSIYAIVSRTGRAAYASSKAGLNGLMRTAALEFAEKNVLVNSVCPGFVETDLTRKNNSPEQIELLRQQVPLKRLGQPHEIAELVFFLGSEANTFITGQTVIADGGFMAQ